MRLKIVRFVWIFLVGLCGCLSGPDCFDTTSNYVNMGFYDADGDLIEVEVDSIAISGLDAYLVPDDLLETFRLPLNPSGDYVEITFFIGEETRTVSLTYELETKVVSENCGALAYLVNLQLSETTFEEVTITNNRLASNAGINVKIRVE